VGAGDDGIERGLDVIAIRLGSLTHWPFRRQRSR